MYAYALTSCTNNKFILEYETIIMQQKAICINRCRGRCPSPFRENVLSAKYTYILIYDKNSEISG
jgi:hypothetical protein